MKFTFVFFSFMSFQNESYELTDQSKSSPETSVTTVSVQVKNQPKQKKKDEEKVKKYNKEIETLKQEKCKIEKDIVLLGGKPDELLKLDDSHSYSESIATSYSLPVQPKKGKDTKKFNDLVRKLRHKMEKIEELEKKKGEKVNNAVAEMSGEPKESKKQSVSSSSLQFSSKGLFPHRRSSSQKNKKATAAERSENASLSSLPHHSSSPEVPQETEQHSVAELVRKLKEKEEEIEHLKIEKETQTTEAQKESQRSQERIKELENDVEKEKAALLQVEEDAGGKLADENERILKLEEDKRYVRKVFTIIVFNTTL